HDVPGNFLRSRNKTFCRFAHDIGFVLRNFESVEIFFDDGTRLSRNIDKAGERTAARNGFDADRSGAGTQIQETRTFADARRDDVKKRFAETIGRRARLVSRKTFYDAAFVFTGDNSHRFNRYRQDRNADPVLRTRSVRTLPRFGVSPKENSRRLLSPRRGSLRRERYSRCGTSERPIAACRRSRPGREFPGLFQRS